MNNREENSHSYLHRGGNTRCRICDRTDSEEIMNNPDETLVSYFVADPEDPLAYICGECDDAIRETREDYELLDEANEEENATD